MQKLAIFTAILLSNFLLACGFYPYGEDVRFSFLNPDYFSYQKYKSFYYSSLRFGDEYYNPDSRIFDTQNEELWRKYCKNKVAIDDIADVLTNYAYSDISPTHSNTFLQYLYKTKDVEAINYLKFAKNCEYFNTWQDDPWERNTNSIKANRSELIKKATTLAAQSKNSVIEKRYAFLAIRMAFYNDDMKLVNKLYHQYFNVNKSVDIIDAWALYFKAIEETNPELKNLYFAEVFAKCPEKRFVSWQYFISKLPEQEVLNYAKNGEQRSHVLLMYGLYNSGKNIDNLKKIYAADPNSEGLGFLLSREINKLEDWIYTPYYTLFDPAISGEGYPTSGYDEYESVQRILQRSEFDRQYANRILEFISSVDLSKVQNPDFWRFAKAELLLMTKDYKGSLQQIAELERSLPEKSEMRLNLEQIKVLNLFAEQSYGKAVIPEETKNIIVKNKNNRRFIFALGRELEYLGNTDDAALLYASLDNERTQRDYMEFNYVYFKSSKITKQTYDGYFWNYFYYLDAVYTPDQVLSFIKKAQILDGKNDSFSQNFVVKKAAVNALYDLLGTKYLRQNKLSLALNIFQKLGEEYYDVQYSFWERNGKNAYDHSNVIFDDNPFYQLKYTPDFVPEKEQFRINKITILRKLIEYIKKADNPKEKNRDYYYFLVANCYYNMAQYGNVWMMKRYSVSSYSNFSLIEDNEEFNSSNLAKFYYGKALENAKTDKFKALCLRMQGRCENNRLGFEREKTGQFPNDSLNTYYRRLKEEYPRQYNDMMSSCDFFSSYFKARR